MKKTLAYCDICGHEVMVSKPRSIEVVFTTEQDEGRATYPYLTHVEIDICHQCLGEVLSGKHIFATGAMGHNKYSFDKPGWVDKKLQEGK